MAEIPIMPAPAPEPEAGSSHESTVVHNAQDRFAASWGEMGTSWGIPRTMAEAHALLYIVGEPLNTDEIMARLGVSRGSASMSLRALLDWGTVNRVHKRGDRKDYFRAEQDIWRMFRTILRERKRREIDPVLMSLYECRDLTSPGALGKNGADSPPVQQHNRRLDQMIQFMEMIDSVAERFISPAGEGLRSAADLLGGEEK